MDLMPYYLEKGPPWSVVESVAGTSKRELYEQLLILRDKRRPITDLKAFSSSTLNAGPDDTYPKRAGHFRRHWMGYTKGPKGWRKQPSYKQAKADAVKKFGRPDVEPWTGWWTGYFGDVEGILRETFSRAIEIALGIDHDRDLAQPSRAPRLWPITIVMKCPTPWFEGWVTWRKLGTNGHVYVHLLIPNHYRANVLTSPLQGRNLPDFEIDPQKAVGDNGMWVISEQQKTFCPPPASSSGTKTSEFPHPGLGPTWVGSGKVCVVNPAEADGGVLHDGRPWKP